MKKLPTSSLLPSWAMLILLCLSAPCLLRPAYGLEMDEAQKKIAALPETNGSDRIKKSLLEWVHECAQANRSAKMERECQLLLQDIETGISMPAVSMLRREQKKAKYVTALRPVIEKTNNPYLLALNEWGRIHLAKQESPWLRATAESVVMPGLQTRGAGEELRRYLWLFLNPSSTLRGDPEVLKRVLRRANAFIDAALLNAQPGTKVKTEIYDQFATEEGFGGVIELLQAFPHLLLPNQRKQWHAGLKVVFDSIWPQMKRANNWNLNIETARMVAVLHFGYYYDKKEVVQKVLKHAETTLAKMRPDGGFPYNGESNPSCNYHGTLVNSLTKIYDLSQHQPILKGLVASQWKGPVMGRTDEFWTSPFHKTYRWNFGTGTEWGNQLILSATKNPYVAGLVRGKTAPDRDAVAWYRSGIVPRPLPDRYTIVDRNIDGPRAWYGRFNYAATMHVKSAKEKTTGGHETLMGCMTVDDPDGRVNSILVNVTPRVKIDKQDTKDAKGTVQSTAWAQLCANLQSSYLTGKNYSASSARFDISTIRGGAYQGKVSDWESRQIWIGLPDRIVGLLSTKPKKDGAVAAEINAVLRLISAGTAGAAVCKTLEKVADRHYRYGELDIILHHSNYAQVTMDVIPYRLPKFPASELTLRAYRKDQTIFTKHAQAKEFLVAVEVRPIWAKGEATVTMSSVHDLLSLRATVHQRDWQVFYNAASKPAEVRPQYPSDLGKARLRLSHVDRSVPKIPAAPNIVLPPNQQAVVITSNDPMDHQPGWNSFAEMVQAN